MVSSPSSPAQCKSAILVVSANASQIPTSTPFGYAFYQEPGSTHFPAFFWCSVPHSREQKLNKYLTVILRGRAGYELIYITNEAVGRVGYYQLISGKSEKNNCFSKFSSSPITGNCHSTHLFPLHKTYSENIT